MAGITGERSMSEVICDKRIPPHMKGKIRKMTVQLCAMEWRQ